MLANRQLTNVNVLSILMVLLLIRLVAAAILPFADTTEPRYAEIARLMAETNDWITPWFSEGTPFWGKPPLSFWSQAIFIKLFGSNELAIRFPSVLMSVLTIMVMGKYANHQQAVSGEKTALYASVIYLSMALPFISTAAVMTDTFLVLGTTLSILGFLYHLRTPDRFSPYYFYIGIAIGMLAKGPIAAIFCITPIIAALLVSPSARIHIIHKLYRGRSIALLMILVLPWYLLAEIKTPGFLNYFILGEHIYRFLDPGWQGDLYGSAHDRPRGTIWLYWIMASFPWGILCLGMLFTKYGLKRKSHPLPKLTFEDWVIVFAILTPLIFFTAAGNILWTYTLPSLPFTALLIAKQLQNKQTKWIPILALLVPLTTTVLTGLIIVGNIQLNSQKSLVAEAVRHGETNHSITYLNHIPFSGRFYTQGQATAVDLHSLLTQLHDRNDQLYLIVSNRELGKIDQLDNVNIQYLMNNGKYSLLTISTQPVDNSQISAR